jgi:hypothetical protein
LRDKSTKRAGGRRLPWLSRGLGLWAAVVCAVATWVPTALAQNTALAPKPSKPVIQWLAALGMAGLCCAIAFKNAKRSHMG